MAIRMLKVDPETGEVIPSTAAEQAEALASLRANIRAGKLKFSEEIKAQLIEQGMTQEIIESWLAEKDSD